MQDKEVRECEDILEDLYNFSPNNNEICLADYVITSDLLSELQDKLEQSQQDLKDEKKEHNECRFDRNIAQLQAHKLEQDLKVAVEALENVEKVCNSSYDDWLSDINKIDIIATQALAKLRKADNKDNQCNI